MKTRIFSLFVIAVMAISTLSAQTSFQSGLEKAKTSNKKVLINIYSDNDTWSQKMETVYSSGNIMNYINSNFVYVKLNGEGSDKINYNEKNTLRHRLQNFWAQRGTLRMYF